MGKMSRNKGKTGERELAKVLQAHGYDARRGQQFKGGNDSADVVGLPGIHIECKRVETLRLWDSLAQAQRDAEGSGDLPAVIHCPNGRPWIVIMTLEDWLQVYEGGVPDEH